MAETDDQNFWEHKPQFYFRHVSFIQIVPSSL